MNLNQNLIDIVNRVKENQKDIIFDKKKHEYLIDGKKFLSPSKIIYGDYYANKTDEQLSFIENFKIIGNNIHKLTELIDKKQEISSLQKQMLDPYDLIEKKYIKWKEETGFEPFLIEEIVYSKKLFTAGTFDRVYIKDNKFYLADIKTSPAKKEHWQQMWLYKIILENVAKIKIEDMMVIYIQGQSGEVETFFHNDLKETNNIFAAVYIKLNNSIEEWMKKNNE